MMRIFLYFLLITHIGVVPALAEESYEDLVDRLVEVTEAPTRKLVADSLDTYSRDLALAIVRENSNFPEEALVPIAKEIMGFLMVEILDNPEIKKIKYEIYKEHFNLAELKELVSFYETETGEKVLTEFPIIMQKAQERAPSGSASMQEKLNANMHSILNKVAQQHGW